MYFMYIVHDVHATMEKKLGAFYGPAELTNVMLVYMQMLSLFRTIRSTELEKVVLLNQISFTLFLALYKC